MVNLNKGGKVSKAVHLDFNNAFNALPRQELLNGFTATNLPYWLVEWVHSCFTRLSQFIRAHNKAPATIPNNCGVLHGAVLSPFSYTLHTSDLFSESLVSFIEYADDVVNSHSFMDAHVHFIIINAFKMACEEWPKPQPQQMRPTHVLTQGKCCQFNDKYLHK